MLSVFFVSHQYHLLPLLVASVVPLWNEDLFFLSSCFWIFKSSHTALLIYCFWSEHCCYSPICAQLAILKSWVCWRLQEALTSICFNLSTQWLHPSFRHSLYINHVIVVESFLMEIRSPSWKCKGWVAGGSMWCRNCAVKSLALSSQFIESCEDGVEGHINCSPQWYEIVFPYSLFYQ